MQQSRTQNATRNIVFGILQTSIAILAPFVTRTIILHTLGANYIGLNSLFSSILQVLSMADLGFGSVMIFSLYKPMSQNETHIVRGLLTLYRRIFIVVGSVMVFAGVAIMPFLRYLVKADMPTDINLHLLYLLFLFNTTSSYFLLAYKQSLLVASQRKDIISKITMIVHIILYTAQSIVLITTKSYYFYVLLFPISTIATNLISALKAKKLYPQYYCEGTVDDELKKSIMRKTAALFGTKMNAIVLHSSDVLVISSFIGLTAVATYTNYYYIINAVVAILTAIHSSITAGIGQSIVMDSKEKVHKLYNKLTFINSWLVGFFATCLLCLYQPFMRLWIRDESHIYKTGIMILFVVFFYIYQMRKVALTFKDAGGLWWEDRFRPYVMMSMNIGFNIFLVQRIGIYGVLVSTILSQLISIPWENWTLYKFLFTRSSIPHYKNVIKYVLVTSLVALLSFYLCSFVPGYSILMILIRLCICVIVVNVSYFFFYRNLLEFREMLELIYVILRRKV